MDGSCDNDDEMKRRDELLLRMYDQLWTSINSHLLVVWQSLGFVIGAFTLMALVEKDLLPLDFAVSIIVVLFGWMIANVIDASYWYNRNLVIISNIEKDFLLKEDEIQISFYFKSHRKNNQMIKHFQIQMFLGISVAFLVLAYHTFMRFISPNPITFKYEFLLPYITLLAVLIYLAIFGYQR